MGWSCLLCKSTHANKECVGWDPPLKNVQEINLRIIDLWRSGFVLVCEADFFQRAKAEPAFHPSVVHKMTFSILAQSAKREVRHPSPEIEDILLPHSLVSGVCYIAVG